MAMRALTPPARFAACFAIGAVLGPSLDAIHVYGDVLEYHDPGVWETAWWVIPQFGLVGVAGALAIPAIERAAGPSMPPRWSADRLVGELMLFASLYLATTLVASGEQAGWLTAGLFALAGLRLALAPVQGDWAYAVGAAILGPLGEIVISAAGLFDYVHPDVAGIPYWLPALWANGGLLLRRVLLPVVSRA
jgi:hypothetical protein